MGVIAVLILLIKYRLSLRYCIKTEDKTVPSHKILQYTTYQEPRYVQTQYTVQYPRTYQYSGVSTCKPSSTYQYSGVSTCKPSSTYQYCVVSTGGFTTNTGQYRINKEDMYCSDPTKSYKPHSEDIYQTVSSTISEI